ncbi:MAG: hypothetical protein H8E81_09830 [Deltaproteobacteria bacterium]|nr:hypothetical protein [Deltaproteobacteria bacterium]
MNAKIAQCQERIRRIKVEISGIGEMTPGSISEQFNVCGNPNCRCKDPDNPQKHGPYLQLSYTRKKKSTTEFVRKEIAVDVRKAIENYHAFRKLTEEWVDLSIEIRKLRRQGYRKRTNPTTNKTSDG